MPVLSDSPEIEFLAGRPLAKVSPKQSHAVVQLALASLVRDLARGRGKVGTEWRFRLAARPTPTSLVPDVAFVSTGRLAKLPPRLREEPPFAPDLAIEIRSPSDRIANVRWKMHAYLEAGAALALDVVVARRKIVAYGSNGVREYAEGDAFAHEALSWLSFRVADAFADLD